MGLLKTYAGALRDEPKMRFYALSRIASDIGMLAFGWAGHLVMTNLAITQRARASFMVPTLLSLLLGSIVSGPLADWAERFSLGRLARWRWRVVLAQRVASLALAVYLVAALGHGEPTIPMLLPFMLGSAFLKTAFGATENAFQVDLLRHESTQLGDDGLPLSDERGEPLRYKTHLLSLSSLVESITLAGTFVALLVGGIVMKAASGRLVTLVAFDVVANVICLLALFFLCHPQKRARNVRLADLVYEERTPAVGRVNPIALAIVRFVRSIAEGLRFLAARERRTLLILLTGTFLVEVVNEAYNGQMIVKHLLHGSDDAVRYSMIAWSFGRFGLMFIVPLFARWIGGIGRIFVITMLLDGVVIALAGRLAGWQSDAAIVPFVVASFVDHALTGVCANMAGLATNSASSTAMRGRIMGTMFFVHILGDVGSEMLATVVSERIGIPTMVERIGLLQVIVVLVLVAIGGKRLWSFGLHPDHEKAHA
ncbi:hypothetical protein LZC95_08695 [Pendulispora brunnea]|uniref:MFS transporter n=1 Tax=Pendulispora brunnea TaxID=2905690 RepID=A0ABZ2KE98_9BACT